MRLLKITAALAVAACHVPDKQPLADGGVTPDADPGPIETTLTRSPSQFSNETTATFEFESNLATAQFACSFDGEPAMPCTSPFSRALSDGTHSFSVRAHDGAGSSDETPAEHLWSIDTIAPGTTLTESPPAADNSTMVRFTFSSTEANVAFECSLDNGAYQLCRSGDMFGPVGDGAHSFAVRAKDRAGNVDATPAIHAWVVDTSTPDTQLLSAPADITSSTTATFTFVSPDAGAGATFECSLDSAPFTACTSPREYSALAMGTHVFAVRVRDAVGNLDPTPATRRWLIDATAPETTITDGPSGVIAMASVSISFTASEASATFMCSLDGAAPMPCTSPFDATALAQGAHTFSVTATDAAGNADATPATATWTVDTIAPELTITGGPAQGSTVGPRVVFTFTASEGVIECRLDNEDPWMPCASPFAFNTANGSRTFYLRATDAAGNIATVNRSFEVTCSAPDPTGALGLLHLDDNAQTLANATGGAGATLGTTADAEAVDPTFVTGRFGSGLAFNAGEGDLVSWPLAAGAAADFTIELWVLPSALVAGTRDLFVSGDGRIAIRVGATTNSTVVISAAIASSGGVMYVASSASVSADVWHHVLVSVDEPTLRLWVSGDRTEVGAVALGTPPALDSIRLGGNYSGTLDEVWVAGFAITDEETALGRFCPASGFSL